MTSAAIPIVRAASPASFDDLQRPSYVSSSPSSRIRQQLSSSRASSVSSPPRDDLVNPVHALAFASGGSPAQEVHIVKVTDDTVQLERGPMADSLLHKVGASLAHAAPGFHAALPREPSADSNVGPPPPSPPSSVEGEELLSVRKHAFSASLPEASTSSRPLTFEEPLERTSSASRDQLRAFPRVGSQGLRHRTSAETKSSLRAPSLAFTESIPDVDDDHVLAPSSTSKASRAGSHISVDGFLQPPVPHKPSRRNTIGTAIPGSSQHSPPRVARMATMTSTHPTTIEDAGELADDIEQQAEQIRRERIRRAKQAEAERALTRSGTTLSRADDRPLVGNLIGEDHVNYVLMYNMLTGIRIAVSLGVSAKRARRD